MKTPPIFRSFALLMPVALVMLSGCAQVDSTPATLMKISELDLKWEAHEIVSRDGRKQVKRAFINPVPVVDDPTAIEFLVGPGEHAVIVDLGPYRRAAIAVIKLNSEVERRYRVGFQEKRGQIKVLTWDVTDTTIAPKLVATVSAKPPHTDDLPSVRRGGVANEAAPARPTEYNPPPSLLFPPR